MTTSCSTDGYKWMDVASLIWRSPSDALDYTEKWLEDTVKCLREAEADSSGGAASSDPPSLLPLNVHNHAYLRLLRWDHASDPFPEVNAAFPFIVYFVFLPP